MAFNRLKDFFRVLSPDGTLQSSTTQSPTEIKTLTSILKEHILNPSGLFYTYEFISKEIESHFTPKNDVDSSEAVRNEKKKQKLFFHAIGQNRVDLDDKDYWDDLEDIYGLVPELVDEVTKERMKVSVFAIRDPYVSPSTRGTPQIETFLNYMPSIVVSQMVPYLDVEFQIRRAPTPSGKEYLSTPSAMRFLLGSKTEGNLNSNDRLLSRGEVYEETEKEKTYKVAVSGMEMFLMPQTLSNMDSLGEQDSRGEVARLARVKPFLPFASIEGFDVNIQNAGAGSFAHKTASLKLKIHDKARIGELSEFFRGEVGFKQALIWTTYGWTAPIGRKDDEYSEFINKNMLLRECWQVVNSQFSFDQTGQVSLNIQLVSSAAKTTQSLTVCEIDEDLKNFHKTIQWINELKKKAAGDDGKFSINVTAEQILNAASTNGIFKDKVDMDAGIQSLLTSFRGTGNVTTEEVNQLKEKLNSLRGENSHANFSKKSAAIVKKKFDSMARSETSKDPFLPVERKKDYYPGPRGSRLIEEVQSYIALNEERNKAVEPSVSLGKLASKHKKESKTGASNEQLATIKAASGVNLSTKQLATVAAAVQTDSEESEANSILATLSSDVVSFGKLFTAFVAPSIMKSKNADELQIFFYGMGDKCGPMSGLSLAEFPVNLKELALAYNDAIKRANVDSLSVQAFLKLVIETQFVNKASIAYGQNRFYKIVEENGVRKTVLEDKDKDKRDGMEKWLTEFGPLTLPVVEMFIETGEPGTAAKDIIGSLKKTSYRSPATNENTVKSNNLIMRIHIYDRSNNPYSTMQKIVNTGNGIEVGDIDSGLLESFVTKLKDSTSETAYNEIIRKLRADQRNYRVVLGELAKENTELSVLTSALPNIFDFDIIKRPGNEIVKVPSDRKSFRDAIMRAVPSINIGTNGSLVLSVNVASKTDGTIGAIRLIDASKGIGPGKATLNDNGLTESNDLPLRVVPVQLTMSTLGIPIAQLYQTYFVDFETGTSLDNIYSCSQLQHSISQGKFTTNMTFIYTDGYGKFGAPPGINTILANKMQAIQDKEKQAAAAQPANKPPQPKTSGRRGGSSSGSKKSGSTTGNSK